MAMADFDFDSMVITPDQLAYDVDGIVQECVKNVKEASEEDIQATADYVVEDLKASSPVLTGKYAKGWRSKMHHAADGSPFVIISNGTKPGLTHLLEHGHGGPHPAHRIPHIEPAYNRGAQFLNERLGE